MRVLEIRAIKLMQSFSIRETLSYGWVGLVGVALDAGSFYFLREHLHWNAVLATTVSAIFAAISTFPLNRHFTFRKYDDLKKRLVKYIVINLFGVVLGAAIMYAGHSEIGLGAGMVKAVGIAIVAGTQFLMNKFIAFK